MIRAFVGLTRDRSSDYERTPVFPTSGTEETCLFTDDQTDLPSLEEMVKRTAVGSSPFRVHSGALSAMPVVQSGTEDQVSFIEHGGLYSVENTPETHRFLQSHPQVMEVLEDAQEYVTEYFGPEAGVVLTVRQDPAAHRKELIAKVVTDLPMEDAFAQLQAFGRHWFTREFVRVDGLINFDVACV